MSAPPPEPPYFPLAGQPDHVLSMERDDYYCQTMLGRQVAEVLQALPGPRRCQILLPEVQLLAACLYYSLTSLVGKQTLGQEYCDLLLVESPASSRIPRRLSSSRRQWYVLLQLLLPYVLERLREGWGQLSQLRNPLEQHRMAVSRAQARALGTKTAAVSEEAEPVPAPREGAEINGESWANALASRLSRLSRHRERLNRTLTWAQKVHLMVFFFQGHYYLPARRAAGVDLMYCRSQEQNLAKYHILGIFMLVQMSVNASRAVGAILPQLQGEGMAREQSAEQTLGMVDARFPASPTAEADDYTDSAGSDSQCSLCMSPRHDSAATPCGHLFCWSCLLSWCQARAECPLCRHPALPNVIVKLHQYD
ncbi:unnamed protein product [Chrysoparadoxa australica]